MPSERGDGQSPGARLRALLRAPDPLVLPFAYDALSARLIEDAGFGAAGISGSALAASLLALPDVGLVSREEVVAQARRMTGAVHVPVIADADTGYGGPLQAARTIRELEQAGVAGLFIEDQRDPKRCGHLAATAVIPTPEMLAKLRAVLDARTDRDFVVIARTDAIASEGLEAAAARARAYLQAGADLAFVAAPRSREEVAALPGLVGGPLMIVLTEGGRTPLLGAAELGGLGYRVVGFSGIAIGVAARAVRDALDVLHREGSTASLAATTMSLDERNGVLRLAEYQAMEAATMLTEEGRP